MNRTTRLKLLYLVVTLGLGAVAVGLVVWLFPTRKSWAAITVALFLLVPGRVQGFFFRDLFRGIRLAAVREYEDALAHYQAFLEQLSESPWKKKLLWLGWTIYTTDAEAMTWNNIGSARLESGRLDEAEDAFRRALSLDALYPLPHFNSAKLALARGDRDEAARQLERSADLGYDRDTLDSLLHKMQRGLAKVEGRGE